MPTIIDDPRDLLTATETDERTDARPDSWIVRLPQIVELSGGETLTIDPATGSTSLTGLPGWVDGTATAPREDGTYAPDTSYSIVSVRGEAGSDGTLNFVESDTGSQLLEFTPNPSFSGITELQIDLVDDQGAEGTGWVTIAVDNQAPTSADSFFTVQEDTVFDLVGGATDPDGDEIWVASFEQISGPGYAEWVTYGDRDGVPSKPTELLYNFSETAPDGKAVIQYTLTDGLLESEVITLTIQSGESYSDGNLLGYFLEIGGGASVPITQVHDIFRETQIVELSAGEVVEIDPLAGLLGLEGHVFGFKTDVDEGFLPGITEVELGTDSFTFSNLLSTIFPEIDGVEDPVSIDSFDDGDLSYIPDQIYTISRVEGEAADFVEIITDESGAQKIVYTAPIDFSGVMDFELYLQGEDGASGFGAISFAVDNLPPSAGPWSISHPRDTPTPSFGPTSEEIDTYFRADLSDQNGDDAWVQNTQLVLGLGELHTDGSEANRAVFRYYPTVRDETGYIGIEYSITDRAAVTDPEVIWTWAGDNTAPIWTGPTELQLGLGETATLELLGNWIDPELHGIILEAVFAPDGVSLDGSLLTLSFDTAGTYRLAIGVTDEFGAEALELIDVTVSDGGLLPLSEPNTYYINTAFSVWGSLTEESSNSFAGFGEGDLLTVLGGSFGWDQLSVDPNLGTAKATLPDGLGGTMQVMLEGDYSGGTFMLVETDEGTQLSFARYLAALSEGVELDQSAVNGVVNTAYLMGNGMRDFQIELSAMSGAGYANVVGVYEVAADGTIDAIEVLFANAQSGGSALLEDVTDDTSLGFFLVQDAADLLAGLKSSDTLDFVTKSGADANAFGGEAAYLSVNGQMIEAPVFHSIDHLLNADGLQHVVSGADPGGQSITMGFEDLLGGGDRDYQDVVFQVTALDAIV